MLLSLNKFITDKTGKAGIGDTDANKGQCVGLVEVFFDLDLAPHVWGNAIDLYGMASNSFFVKGTTWPAPAGTAVTFGVPFGRLSNGTYAGHTGISLGDGRVFEQNTDPLTPHVHDYGKAAPKGYIGWFIPRDLIIGDFMAELDLARARVLSWAVLGRNGTDGHSNALNGDADADLNQFHVGKEAFDEIWAFYQSGEGQEWITKRFPALITKAALAEQLQGQLTEANTKIAQLTEQYQIYVKAHPDVPADNSGNVVITPKGWTAAFNAIKAFFSNNK